MLIRDQLIVGGATEVIAVKFCGALTEDAERYKGNSPKDIFVLPCKFILAGFCIYKKR